jgi:thiamine pyrophosphokinase
VTILGASGGRIDHWLANVMLLAKRPGVRIVDETSEIWVAEGQASLVGRAGDVVSLIPLDERVEGVVTQGLEFPLKDETLERGSTRGLSNVMLGERAEVTWEKGLLLVAQARRAASGW